MKYKGLPSIPSEIILGGNSWKIIFKNKLDKRRHKHKVTMGMCIFPDREIWIKTGLGDSETLRTLLHEILHACEYEGNFKLLHDHVYKLENLLTDFFLINF